MPRVRLSPFQGGNTQVVIPSDRELQLRRIIREFLKNVFANRTVHRIAVLHVQNFDFGFKNLNALGAVKSLELGGIEPPTSRMRSEHSTPELQPNQCEKVVEVCIQSKQSFELLR